MKILLSIKPEFAFKIFEGIKKYEYRRGIFKRGDVEIVVVYACSPVKMVIGEFFVGSVLCENPQQLWNKTKFHSGISKEKFFEYFSNIERGYAIEVTKPKMYDRPLALDRFMIASPPQSFVYL